MKKALAANNHAFSGYGAEVPLPDLAKRSTWEDGDLRYDATIMTHYEGIELKFPYFKKLQNLDQTLLGYLLQTQLKYLKNQWHPKLSFFFY